MTKKAASASDPTDIAVGMAIRQRRLLLSRSQTQLAVAMGISFQQIQKYESGFNRISASRLWAAAHYLHCPINHFFRELTDNPYETVLIPMPAHLDGLLCINEGLDLAKAFLRIPNLRIRTEVLHLIAALSQTRTDDD
jgi:transcriptional regulator with XRE-family HTH domain